MVAKAVIEQRCKDYYWAAIKVARATWRQYGQRTTITREDAEAEGLLALTEAAASANYDERRGTFGGFAKQAVLRAVRRQLFKAQTHIPVEEIRGGSTCQSESGEALRVWVAKHPEQAQSLTEYIDGVEVTAAGEWAMRALQKATGINWRALQAHSTQAAAKRLRINERRVRDLAERGELTGRQVSGQWRILTNSCAAYRERRVVNELRRKPTIAAAARAVRVTPQRAGQIAKRVADRPRRAGRPPKIDIELALSILTDPIRHRPFWRRGKPRMTLIADTLGCHRDTIYEVLKTAESVGK